MGAIEVVCRGTDYVVVTCDPIDETGAALVFNGDIAWSSADEARVLPSGQANGGKYVELLVIGHHAEPTVVTGTAQYGGEGSFGYVTLPITIRTVPEVPTSTVIVNPGDYLHPVKSLNPTCVTVQAQL